MINMAIILNSSIDEDNVQEVLDIVLNKYLESDDLVSSSKKLLKEKYNDYKKYVPYDDYGIGSFNEFVEEFYNVIGFVNDSPITTFNPEKIFESFEIEDIYRQYEVDIYDIVEDLDYLVTKTGSLYENDSYKSTPNKEFIKILEKCKYDDYIIIIIGND